jgi:hypothetical protein
MERARGRKLKGYIERHHVIPKCLGGSNAKQNIVRLTPEEHYVSHQLLVKLYPGNIKLLWAASNMTGATQKMPGRKNKLYGWLRRKLREGMTGRIVSEETRALLRQQRHVSGMQGKKHSEETKAKMSAAAKGRKKSPEHCAALSASFTGKKRGPQSAEHKAKLSESNKQAALNRDFSFMQSEAYRKLQSQRSSEQWARRRAGLLPPRNNNAPYRSKETQIGGL